MTKAEAKQLKAGDRVRWNDPDGGTCSKVFTIATISVRGDMVQITHTDGVGVSTGLVDELEALPSELERAVSRYCILCGNEQTDAPDGIGDQCRAIITTSPMDRAFAFWQTQNEQTSRCCGGLSTDKDHLYFHSKHWECVYPSQPEWRTLKNGTRKPPTKKAMKEWEQLSVGVEMGVSFYPEGAQTYYVRDFNSYCDSEEYGDLIPYPDDVCDNTFWNALDKQLDQAAEAAFNSDLLSCHKCGYHYVSSAGPCDCTGNCE